MECYGWPISEWNVYFNTDYYTDYLEDEDVKLRGISAHEVGHALGIAHSGLAWAWGGGAPTMSTCAADGFAHSFAQRAVAKDDSAMLGLQNDRVGTFGAATANPSFEEEDVDEWWVLEDVGTWQQRSPGVDGSGHYLAFRSITTQDGKIRQTVRLGSQDYDGDEDTRKVKVRINHRKDLATDQGTVTAKLEVQRAPHVPPLTGTCDSGAFAPLSWNRPGGVSGWDWTFARTFQPISSWSCGKPESMPSCDDVPADGFTITDGTAWDLKILFVNHMTTSLGGVAYVGIDRARVLYDGPTYD
jgi:hypothetical protein